MFHIEYTPSEQTTPIDCYSCNAIAHRAVIETAAKLFSPRNRSETETVESPASLITTHNCRIDFNPLSLLVSSYQSDVRVHVYLRYVQM